MNSLLRGQAWEAMYRRRLEGSWHCSNLLRLPTDLACCCGPTVSETTGTPAASVGLRKGAASVVGGGSNRWCIGVEEIMPVTAIGKPLGDDNALVVGFLVLRMILPLRAAVALSVGTAGRIRLAV
jgi:hypothetical protein